MALVYYDYDTGECFREQPKDRYFESFTPLDGMNAGYLVYYSYYNYDSFNKDTNLSYSIIDLYPDYATARKVCVDIREDLYNNKEIIHSADGREIYPRWKEWGSEFHSVYLRKIEIKDHYEPTFEEF